MSSKARLVALVLLSSLVLGCSVEDAIPWATEEVPTAPALYDMSGHWAFYKTPLGGSEEGPASIWLIYVPGSDMVIRNDGGAVIGTATADGPQVTLHMEDERYGGYMPDPDHMRGSYYEDRPDGYPVECRWRAERMP